MLRSTQPQPRGTSCAYPIETSTSFCNLHISCIHYQCIIAEVSLPTTTLILQLCEHIIQSHHRIWSACEVAVLPSCSINPLTTNDDNSRHRNLAACYQLAQSVLKIGSALAERGGGWVSPRDSAWRLLQLAVEKPWSMPGRPLFCFLVQTGLENTAFTL